MKRFIRYLYEYEQGRRMRNVGFVKVEQDDDVCVVHIHGKGLRMEGERKLNIYLFYEKGNQCIGIPQGSVDNVNPSVNYQLKYTDKDVGKPENYPLIEGIIMENNARRRYAAVWDDMPVNVNEMIVWKPEEEPMTGPDVMPEEEMIPEEEIASEEEIVAEEEFISDEIVSEEVESEEEVVSDEIVSEEEIISDEIVSEEEVVSEEEFISDEIVSEEEQIRQELVCTKIQRRDIARLPRCEWRLSNNSFLLHGCHNYHHLLLIDDGKNMWLGVPGIYHEKEARVAEAFGFPQFIKVEEVDIVLAEDEQNDREEFGYWCRHVRRSNM